MSNFGSDPEEPLAADFSGGEPREMDAEERGLVDRVKAIVAAGGRLPSVCMGCDNPPVSMSFMMPKDKEKGGSVFFYGLCQDCLEEALADGTNGFSVVSRRIISLGPLNG